MNDIGDVKDSVCVIIYSCLLKINHTLTIMYIYHALTNALSAHIIHINLNMIVYTYIEDSPTKTTYLRQYVEIHTHTHTHTHTHARTHARTHAHTHTHTRTHTHTHGL